MWNIYTFNSGKGTFIRKNPVLEAYLEERGHNTDEVWDQIIKDRGSVMGLPDDIISAYDKEIFYTFTEINQLALVEQAALRQKYIDQTQSLNLSFDPTDSPKFINLVHQKGVEPLTFRVSDECSNQLSYWCVWERVDSNHRSL